MDKTERLKVIIYGAFDAGKFIADRLGTNVEIVGFADSSETKSKLGFEGYSVWNIEGLKNVDFDKIIIAAKSYKIIALALKSVGLSAYIYHDPALDSTQVDDKDLFISKILNLPTIKHYFNSFRHTASAKNGQFSFGKNWEHFVDTAIDQTIIEKHLQELSWWIEPNKIQNKRVIDIGCGSGLSAWCLKQLGCRELHAFDYDQYSVNAAQNMFGNNRANDAGVTIQQGSILDNEYVQSLGKFDLVHSWGVLHHTGDMKKAISNAVSLCAEGGYLMIALYEKGPRYQDDLKLKMNYNNADDDGKLDMLYSYLKALNFRYQFELEKTNVRGMNPLHDAIDWLGGFPYEVTNCKEVINQLESRGFELRKFKYKPEGGCSVYAFQNCKDI